MQNLTQQFGEAEWGGCRSANSKFRQQGWRQSDPRREAGAGRQSARRPPPATARRGLFPGNCNRRAVLSESRLRNSTRPKRRARQTGGVPQIEEWRQPPGMLQGFSFLKLSAIFSIHQMKLQAVPATFESRLAAGFPAMISSLWGRSRLMARVLPWRRTNTLVFPEELPGRERVTRHHASQ